MAVLLRDPSGGDYGRYEQELQDKILTIYGTNENDDHLFRYVQYNQVSQPF